MVRHSEPEEPSPSGLNDEAVYSAHGGTVAVADWSTSAGWWVAIRSNVKDPVSNNRIVSRYMHFIREPVVSKGAINQGVYIGNVGSTGNSSGSHLHLDFNNNDLFSGGGNFNNFTINPQRFFPGVTFTGATSSVTP